MVGAYVLLGALKEAYYRSGGSRVTSDRFIELAAAHLSSIGGRYKAAGDQVKIGNAFKPKRHTVRCAQLLPDPDDDDELAG